MNKLILCIKKWINEAYDGNSPNQGLSAETVIEKNRQDTIELYKSFNIDVY